MTPFDGAKEHRLEAYATLAPSRRHCGCTAIPPGMVQRSLDSPEANWPDCILFAPLSGASWATQMMPSDSLIVNQQIVYKDQGINPGDRPPRAVPPEGTLINRTNNATVESHYSMSQSPLYCWHR